METENYLGLDMSGKLDSTRRHGVEMYASAVIDRPFAAIQYTKISCDSVIGPVSCDTAFVRLLTNFPSWP